MAHNEHSIGSTEIELYIVELSANEKLKLSHLKIYSDNEYQGDEDTMDNPLPSPPQITADERREISLTAL
ncbi:hypothetical protein D3C73_1490320 [compost metagenome]